MPKLRALTRKETGFTDSLKSRHKMLPNFAECSMVTMTLVWTGVALWLALNAAVAAYVLAVQPRRASHESETVRTPDLV